MKTNNIFLDDKNNCKIGDFGISKILEFTSQKAQTAIGTPYYLSPELCQGLAYDNKSDVWALGVILYELCMYETPFQGGLMIIVMKICKADYAPIPDYYSDDLKELISKLLSKNPEDRPSCQDIFNFKVMKDYLQSLRIFLILLK